MQVKSLFSLFLTLVAFNCFSQEEQQLLIDKAFEDTEGSRIDIGWEDDVNCAFTEIKEEGGYLIAVLSF